MNVKYDVEMHEMIKSSGYKYWRERGIINDFIDSTHSNVVFEYNSNKEARAVAMALEAYIRCQKLPVKSMQRKTKIFIIHKDTEKEGK